MEFINCETTQKPEGRKKNKESNQHLCFFYGCLTMNFDSQISRDLTHRRTSNRSCGRWVPLLWSDRGRLQRPDGHSGTTCTMVPQKPGIKTDVFPTGRIKKKSIPSNSSWFEAVVWCKSPVWKLEKFHPHGGSWSEISHMVLFRLPEFIWIWSVRMQKCNLMSYFNRKCARDRKHKPMTWPFTDVHQRNSQYCRCWKAHGRRSALSTAVGLQKTQLQPVSKGTATTLPPIS